MKISKHQWIAKFVTFALRTLAFMIACWICSVATYLNLALASPVLILQTVVVTRWLFELLLCASLGIIVLGSLWRVGVIVIKYPRHVARLLLHWIVGLIAAIHGVSASLQNFLGSIRFQSKASSKLINQSRGLLHVARSNPKNSAAYANVVLVAGTFFRRNTLAHVCEEIRQHLTLQNEHCVNFYVFNWSGKNSLFERCEESVRLARAVRLLNRENGAPTLVVGHSHGGSLVAFAAAMNERHQHGYNIKYIALAAPILLVVLPKIIGKDSSVPTLSHQIIVSP
jgi:hypothetical protein